ncbi:helix-turn-helix domain-containing protein [Actinokineospora inagensis]|uniref:helix-turn-helix domain-containing protein n=1 Tax=Actinokineospora inagensis TaxID=103730 RepID=UPI000A071DA0|nr:helix-turn-helix transcriptional regulator [Actinokineospora inagensis]
MAPPENDRGIGIRNPSLAKAIGKRLRAAREAHQWTRADVVDKLDYEMHTQTVSTYELGSRRIALETFVGVCEVLGLVPEEVLGKSLIETRGPVNRPIIVDLKRLASIHDNRLVALRHWAQVQLLMNNQVVTIEPLALAMLAAETALSPAELRSALPRAVHDAFDFS